VIRTPVKKVFATPQQYPVATSGTLIRMHHSNDSLLQVMLSPRTGVVSETELLSSDSMSGWLAIWKTAS